MPKVMIVEDDKAQRLLYQMAIEELGHTVLLARDGKEALKMLETNQPDLIILDIMMPNMDGLETLQKKLEKQPSLPVIIHSAYSHFGDDYRSWSAEEYVVKSSDLTHLKNAVRRALSHWPFEGGTRTKNH